jgi:hypothetical protein
VICVPLCKAHQHYWRWRSLILYGGYATLCGIVVAIGRPRAGNASSITLTMDTYGPLFPGQEADTVAKFPDMINGAPERR